MSTVSAQVYLGSVATLDLYRELRARGWLVLAGHGEARCDGCATLRYVSELEVDTVHVGGHDPVQLLRCVDAVACDARSRSRDRS